MSSAMSFSLLDHLLGLSKLSYLHNGCINLFFRCNSILLLPRVDEVFADSRSNKDFDPDHFEVDLVNLQQM